MDFFAGTVELAMVLAVDFDNTKSNIRSNSRATMFVALNIIWLPLRRPISNYLCYVCILISSDIFALLD